MRKHAVVIFQRIEETGEAGARLAQDDQPEHDQIEATRREQERVEREKQQVRQQGFAAHISRR